MDKGRVSITRNHAFCYGHRVYGHENKCCNLHGHNATVEFTCEAADGLLDHLGRVIDFAVIKSRLCQWLEDEWDHRLILWEKDPLLSALRDLDPTVTTLRDNPTAENLARYLVEDVGPAQLAGTGVRLVACVVHETGKCSATYEAMR